jgi:prolyl oligopeptidase
MEFVSQQNALMETVLKPSGIRVKFKNSLTKLMDYPKFGVPRNEGECYYYFYNTGLQAQSVLMTQRGLDDEPKIFLDPNLLSADGTTSLADFSFSESGKFFAYSLSVSGSDWVTIQVKSVGSDADIENPLQFVKFSSIQWTHDDKGFFYNQYPKPSTNNLGTEVDANKSPMLFYHKIGTPQEEDVFVYQDESPDHLISFEVTDDGKFLILYIT